MKDLSKGHDIDLDELNALLNMPTGGGKSKGSGGY
jgi:hypothetical protein